MTTKQQILFLVTTETKDGDAFAPEDMEPLAEVMVNAIADAHRGSFEVTYLWEPSDEETLKILARAERKQAAQGVPASEGADDDGDDDEDEE